MKGFADIIKYFYQQFVLRDLLGYVTPGALILACVIWVKTDTNRFLNILSELPMLAYLVLFGLAFVVGFALQNLGERMGVLKWYYREKSQSGDQTEHDEDIAHLKVLLCFHKAADVVAQPSNEPQSGELPDDWEERTRERIAVKKNMAGTNALAIFVTVVLLLVKAYWDTGVDGGLIVLSGLLIVGLFRGHYHQLHNQHAWEQAVLSKTDQGPKPTEGSGGKEVRAEPHN